MNESREPPFTNADTTNDTESYSLLMSYPEETDYYALLGLARDPPPTDSAIRSAYRTLTLSFHPDKQPADLQDAAKRQFERIQEAYETLVEPRKRVVYDLLGAEGVRREWGRGGAMGRGGFAERQEKLERQGQGQGKGQGREVGVKAMNPQEFRRWFMELMKRREREAVNSLVRSKGSLVIGLDAKDMIWVDEDSEVHLDVPHPKLSSLAVRYSFMAPFPTLRAIIGEDEKEDDEDEQVKDAEDSPTSPIPELEIYAGAGGNLLRYFNEMDLEYEDGETETRMIPLPLMLSTQNINLGASTSRVFNDPNPKGILKRWPFSYLQNSLASFDATVLPETTIQAAVSKSVALIPNTRPFNFVLGTVFSRSLFHAPPSLNLQMTKGISDRKTAFCSWSSGLIEWPLVIEALLSPFVSLGLEIIQEGQEPSQFQVGIASRPANQVSSLADEDDDAADYDGEDEEGEGYEVIRTKKRDENKAAEAWHVALSSSPLMNGFIFKYSRNIFSGESPTKVALSQWSAEKHYSLPPANEPRSVRLDITSSVGLDLSTSWAVHGSRLVSDLTQIGFGVGLQPQGVFMTFSWARLGQRIKLPVLICPFEEVNGDSATLAVLLPWLAYCAAEFGFIRPRERRNRRKLIARQQKKLRKLVPQKRVESEQAVEFMADQVQRRQDREYKRGGLVITKAVYGHYPSKRKADSRGREAEVVDVTIPVAALVDHGQLVISKKTAKFHLLGFHDPAPLQPKTLKVWYDYHGTEHYVEANDSEGITCPMRSHALAA